MQNITNVDVELIRQPKGQNWPTVGGAVTGVFDTFPIATREGVK